MIMLKGPLIVSLLILLALQPAGLLLAKDGDLHVAVAADQYAGFAAACERMNGIDCHVVSHCLVSGHVGCDLNPFQLVADGAQASNQKAEHRSVYDASKLPPNETFPPLRPPRRS